MTASSPASPNTPNTPNTPGTSLASDLLPLLLLAASAVAVHMFIQSPYGYHRDELYLLDCARHPAWGYADQNPLAAAITRLTVATVGDAANMLRIVPALAGAITVLLTGLLARELGGRGFAQGLAAFAALVCPMLLRATSILQPEAFDPLLWTLCLFLAVAASRRNKPVLWIPIGIVLGLVFLNRIESIMLVEGVLIAILLSRYRRQISSIYFGVGIVAAAAMMIPPLLWQQAHGWPYLEIVIMRSQSGTIHIPEWLTFQIFDLPAAGAILTLMGVGFCLNPKRDGIGLFLLIPFLLAVASIISSGDRNLLPAYIPMFAAGAVAFEQFIAKKRSRRLATTAAIVFTLSAMLHAPTAVPVISIDDIDHYVKRLSLGTIKNPDYITNHFHAMFGAESLLKDLTSVMLQLTPEEQLNCTIVTSRYAQAAAVNQFADEYALPLASSPHNSYYFWDPVVDDPELVIAVGLEMAIIYPLFGSIEQLDIVVDDYAIPLDDNLPIYVCRRPLMPLSEMWPKLRTISP